MFFDDARGTTPRAFTFPTGGAMLDELRAELQEEIEAFDRELRIELPKRIAAAVAMGDLSENAEYSSALERQEFVRARLSQLTRRQSELSSIDLRNVPTDAVAFGSRVTIENEDGERQTVTLVFPEFVEFEDDMISIAGPLGRALVGTRPGDEVTLDLPRETIRYEVIDVVTIHGDPVSEEAS